MRASRGAAGWWLGALVAGCVGGGGVTTTAPAGSSALAAGVTSAAATSTASALLGPTPPAAEPSGSLLRATEAPPADLPLPRYAIDLAIDDVGGTFAGTLALHYPNPTGAALDTLPLLLHPNATAEFGGAAGGSGSLRVTEVASLAPEAGATAPTFTVVRPTLVEVRLGAPVPAGATVALGLRFEGRLRQLPPSANDMFAQAMQSLGSMSSGAGAADYGLLAVGDGIVTVASAYPMVAPWREGAFDTAAPARLGDLAYNQVASFRVRTVLPAGVRLVTNLVDGAPTRLGTGSVVVVSAGELVRDFVLVAGRDLEEQSKTSDGVRVRSVFRARDRQAGLEVLDAAVASLGSLARRFGPYPWAELDVAEASLVGGAGGVEFCGMVLVAGMLYRPLESSQSALAMLMKMWGNLGAQITGGLGGVPPGQAGPVPSAVDESRSGALEFTTAHEIAHQYFAGIVGNDSRRFPSLDEPLAQYAAALVIEDRRGAAAAREALDQNAKLGYALYRLLGGPDRPVLRDTQSFRTTMEYAGLVYGKAPYAYVALGRQLGAERLAAAIRHAVARHRFGLATTGQWIDALEQGAGGPSSGVRAVLRRWLEEAHGDADLGITDPGEYVLAATLPPEVAAQLRATLPAIGMKPSDLLRLVFGGAIGDDAPLGAGIDPLEALRKLQQSGPKPP